MTYSILGRDPATGEVGGAVQSAWFSSGVGVLWADAGVGAVATQAIGEPAFGPLGLQLITEGSTPAQVVATLVAGDATPGVRQLGVIDLASIPAAFTGGDCVPDADHQVGADCVAQANMMANPGMPRAMVAVFEATVGDLADRLLAALDAAQALGGDFRGMQSAGLVVQGGRRGTPAGKTSVVNVRVDDHTDPLAELHRLPGCPASTGPATLRWSASPPAITRARPRLLGRRAPSCATIPTSACVWVSSWLPSAIPTAPRSWLRWLSSPTSGWPMPGASAFGTTSTRKGSATPFGSRQFNRCARGWSRPCGEVVRA